MKKILLVTVFFIFSPLLTQATPCYTALTPGCVDVCGDGICGSTEIYSSCPADCSCVSANRYDYSAIDAFSKGYVIITGNKIIEDVCVKDSEQGKNLSYVSDEVIKRSCQGVASRSQKIKCEYGCENGACLKEPLSSDECTDTDGGKNYYVRGIVKSGLWERIDNCINITYGSVKECYGSDCQLVEYFCGDKVHPIKEEWHTCPVGCKDGACISCSGCIKDEKCFSFGTVMGDSYCASTGKFLFQKKTGATCTQDYECENKSCFNGVCSSECKEGCLTELFECATFGTIISNSYCSQEKTFLPAKEIGEICTENYECKNNNCQNSICVFECKEGCLTESLECISWGSIQNNNYCDKDGVIKKQKQDNEACRKNYECINNNCKKSVCQNPNPFINILNWFKGLYNSLKGLIR